MTVHPVVEISHAAIEPAPGRGLGVLFSAGEQPGLLFKPAEGVWDWSRTSRLFIPINNLGDEPLTLLLRLESARNDGSTRSLSAKVTIGPRNARNLTIVLDAPSPRSMGMTAGPSLAAAGSEPNVLPLTSIKGSLDPAHVISVRLGIPRPTAPRRLVVGPMQVEPAKSADRNAYNAIVDTFGQFRPGSWPEKVRSVAMIRAKGAEESRILIKWLRRSPNRDRFGGLPRAGRFAPSGFFRTEQRAGRWWLVTPDGNAFFSIGIDAVEASGSTYVDGREFMFCDIPARQGTLTAHWSQRDDRRGLGAQRGRFFDHGHAFDFYTANLERKFGAEWRRRWREEAVARLKAWGFNTVGDWGDPDLWAMHALPYTVPLAPVGMYAKVSSGEDWWGPMPDPFDRRFADAADRMARQAAARFGSDPYLIGYFVDNELDWGQGWSKNPRERYSVAVGALAAGPSSPAKAAFIAQLAGTYREPARLGRAWGIPLTSWDQLRSEGFRWSDASLDRAAALGDLAAFTRLFAQAYFRTIASALRRHDPHHLYLGSRFAWATPEAVEACARWCDVVSFNLYERSINEDQQRWTRFHTLGKPALIGEFHFGSTDRGLFWEGLVGAGAESERGTAYARYLRAVADNPDFVGAHWFEYIDEPLTGRTLDGENGHIGFVTVADVPYQRLVMAARAANQALSSRLQRQIGYAAGGR